MTDRFSRFNPTERLILQALLQEHANTVSRIAIDLNPDPVNVADYLLSIEALENEVSQRGGRKIARRGKK